MMTNDDNPPFDPVALGLPPDTELLAIEFDPGLMLRKYPGIQRSPQALLDALVAENPSLPREVCAAFAIKFLDTFARPHPGQEEHYANALRWLQQQQGEWGVVDHTPGATNETRH